MSPLQKQTVKNRILGDEMLHILLLILKIIGIVLLSIVGVLLLCIACALFVPIRYRIEASRKEGEGEPAVTVQVKVTWLLHLINFLFRFDGTVFVRARILIFTVFRIPGKEKGRKNRKTVKKEKKGKNKSIQETQEKTEEPKSGEEGKSEDIADDKDFRLANTSGGDSAINEELEDAKEEEDGGDTQEKPSFWDKLRAIWEILQRLIGKIRGCFENIQYTINQFCAKIRSVSDTIEYYREIVEGEPFKRSFALCKDELLTIVKRLKPRKFEASLIVGMADPASTGEILAICGMLYPIIGGHVDVRGDFERKRLEGQALIVGKLRMFTFLRAAVKIYFNKDIRKLYRLLKRRK